ncbi:MAG: ABC transporter permease [Solirubrobacteraceae bacterium]
MIPDSGVSTVEPAPAADRMPLGRRKRRRDTRTAFKLLTLRLAVLGVLIGLWQLVVNFKLADPTVTSRPRDVYHYLSHAIRGKEVWLNLWDTIEAALIAFLLASVVGVIIGIALALLPRVEEVVDPYLNALNALPRIALAPVFVVAFGLSIQAKIALAFTLVVFILISSARAGVRSVDDEHLRLARVLGASRRQMFTKILLPVATPSIFGGLRLGVIYSLLGAVTMELIGSTNGIGQLLQQAAGVFNIGEIYGLIILIALAASLINAAMGYLERYLLRWQVPVRQ